MPGLYQTIFGDIYIDFGPIGGIVQSFIMGAVSATAHVARMRGSLAAQMLDAIFKAFLVMGMFLSSFTSFGVFVLLAAVCTLGLGLLKPRRNITMFQPCA